MKNLWPNPSQNLIDQIHFFSDTYVENFEKRQAEWLDQIDDCSECSGTGEVHQLPCETCSGEEELLFNRSFETDLRPKPPIY
jgi:hypothetical protein